MASSTSPITISARPSAARALGESLSFANFSISAVATATSVENLRPRLFGPRVADGGDAYAKPPINRPSTGRVVSFARARISGSTGGPPPRNDGR